MLYPIRNIWRFLLLAAAVAAPLPAQAPLTLPEAAARALANNPDLAADQPGQEAARLEFQAARAGYLPRLDLEQSYLAGDNPVFVFSTLLSQQRFTAANFSLPELNTPSPLDNIQTRATVQQTLWDFGRTRTRRTQAQLGVAIADQSHADHRRRVLLQVIHSYYAASLASAAVETATLSLRSAEAVELQAKARVDSGLTVDADLLRSRVHLAAARKAALQAQGELESARAQLNRIMGLPLDQPMGDTARLVPQAIELPPEATLLADQKRLRPDYQNLLTELKLAENAVRARQKELLPTVSGFSTWEADNASFTSSGGSNWAAGITLRWNLFAGGSDAAQLDAARQRLEQKRRQITAMESAMALEIRQAVIQHRTAGQQVQAARAAEEQSEEGLRILKNRYDAGLATMTDVLTAETARSAARTNLEEAMFRHRISCAQVEYAAGILSPTSAAMQLP